MVQKLTLLLFCYASLTTLVAQEATKNAIAAPMYTLYYPSNQWEVTATNITFLDTYVVDKFQLDKDKKLIVKLEGHTDAVGSDSSNLELSQKRVQAVADYLMSKGIARAQIQTLYFGESQPETRPVPVSKKQKDVDYANRRVVITLLTTP